ncbi:MAG: endopeptidase La, partial [Pseudomonadales bacterium]
MPDNETTYPVLPLKNTVVYPQLAVPLAVGREKSLAAVEAAAQDGADDKVFITVAQKDPHEEEPVRDDLYNIGTLVTIRRMERGEHGAQVLVQGLQRVVVGPAVQSDPYIRAGCTFLPELSGEGPEVDALVREILDTARKIAQALDPTKGLRMFQQIVESLRDPILQVYRIASLASLDVEAQQEILEAETTLELMRRMHATLTHELQVSELRREIASQAQTDMEQQQREHVLRTQKRAIEQALGEDSPEAAEAAELRRLLEEADLPELVREEAERECKRMERMSANAADFQVARTYLELILELPWNESTGDDLDLKKAHRILDDDHYGLDDVKERILEFLAVMKMNPKAKAPILCFVGAPGVGKTSLGQSIARAIGRKFERLSLGGMHDEAELRGHRRTYIGAMPGRILQAVRRAGVNNPLLMLDEVDKLGRDFRGDPSAALMEILDPEQNFEFRDNYLNLPFDLSKVFFITTANSLESIPRALLDRMELLELSGYSHAEKFQIAKRYLMPRQRKEAGLDEAQLDISDDALMHIIQRYTREAGVRELERTIGRLARKVARKILEDEQAPVLNDDALPELLGPERFFPEKARKDMPPGVAA